MARIVNEQPPAPPAQRRYPWDEWTDGQVRILVPGEDFNAQIMSFRNRCYGIARDRNMRCTIRQVRADDSDLIALKVQFFPRHPPVVPEPADTDSPMFGPVAPMASADD